MAKFNLGDIIFYMKDYKVHSSKVLSRSIVDNLHEDFTSNPEQCKTFARFGPANVTYATIHGEFEESEVFDNRESLIAHYER